jgi:hypothetical protein
MAWRSFDGLTAFFPEPLILNTMEPGTIITTVSLILRTLQRIITLVSEARQFKSECQELGAISATLKIAIEKNQNALTTHDSCTKLQACLSDAEVFVEQCTQKWNLLKHAREVFFDHKLPRLRQDLLSWMAVFTLEGSVSIRHLQWRTANV